jgi:hypothetical protein
VDVRPEATPVAGRHSRGVPDRVLQDNDVTLTRLLTGRLARQSEERRSKRRKGENNGGLPKVHESPLVVSGTYWARGS